MKKILGLDLGSNSIGWALIGEQESGNKIIGMGSRIIPLTPDDKDEFSKGNAISKNQKRTLKRTQRRGYDRYQLRRKSLIDTLKEKEMLPDDLLINLDKVSLWNLRGISASEKIELKQLGRVLLHINQKRGYKSSRSEANLDKKDTEYVSQVKSRYENLKALGLTIGQFFSNKITEEKYYRIKDQVFPREAYEEEYDKIMETQKKFYPDILNDDFIKRVKNEIIFYQRKLKSQKGLVSVCEFEGKRISIKRENGSEKEILIGPKVSPRSSPLFQVCKIWETINTIRLKNKSGEEYKIPIELKHKLFEYLDTHERLTFAELKKILDLKKKDEWYANKMLERGIQGNLTRFQIAKCFDDPDIFSSLFDFDLKIDSSDKIKSFADRETGEICEITESIIDTYFEKKLFYRLWQTIYSIQDESECKNAIIKNFKLSEDVAGKLAKLDFTKAGFSNKSAKAIRKILPYLMEGYVYSDACSLAGYNYSDSITKEENEKRELIDNILNLEKNSLRQPVVEKILNQMINLVNAVIEKYGKPDEIRIELARELKQSKEERKETFVYQSKRERENNSIAKRLESEYGVRSTRTNIVKWRLYNSVDGEESRVNNICIYCGKPFGISEALKGEEVDIEHIIPRSKLFDDSQNNKTLSHRKCNFDKGDRTAFDFMRQKSETEFQDYIERVNKLYSNRIIGKAKRDKFLTPEEKIPKDFIERQLRETQYISRKSREILAGICRNVITTSGTVTDYLRRIWGWDDVLMNLQLPKYRNSELTEWIKEEKNGQVHEKEKIRNWTKRADHRHHAIDALVIACTTQSIIQRLNRLSSDSTRKEMYKAIEEIDPAHRSKRNLLENYISSCKPFATREVEEAASNVLVSFKAGKRVATEGLRKVRKGGKYITVQKGIIIPRGALSEETIYGKIQTIEKAKPVKYLFENPELILKTRIRKLVKERLNEYGNDVKKATASLKKDPLYIDENKTEILKYGTCYKDTYVVKYPVDQIKAKDISSIIDPFIKEKFMERLKLFGGNEKEAFRDLDQNPIWFNEELGIPVRTVRCLTGLNAVEPVKKDKNGKEIGFVKPGNNHHIAIYIDSEGKLHEHICTFWHAVQRKKYGIPVVIEKPEEAWNKILMEGREMPEGFLEKLPEDGLTFKFSMQQNELFILGMQNEIAEELIKEIKYSQISDYLYRVQKLTSNDYFFRHHLETELIYTSEALKMKRFYRINSLGGLNDLNPVKVRISKIGEISLLKL